jgi:hypothetical protein
MGHLHFPHCDLDHARFRLDGSTKALITASSWAFIRVIQSPNSSPSPRLAKNRREDHMHTPQTVMKLSWLYDPNESFPGRTGQID